jgi:hypothetical protein
VAKETHDDIFLGTDFERVFHIKNDAETASIDIQGWTLSYMVKRHHDQADNLALLEFTTGAADIAIAGTFNADPSVNAQRATLFVADEETDTEINQGMYHWELKRTDAGFETVLCYGTFECIKGVHG